MKDEEEKDHYHKETAEKKGRKFWCQQERKMTRDEKLPVKMLRFVKKNLRNELVLFDTQSVIMRYIKFHNYIKEMCELNSDISGV